MTNELIERLAREAGLRRVMHLWCSENGHGGIDGAALSRFAALVAEECAKVAEAESYMSLSDDHVPACIRAKFKAE